MSYSEHITDKTNCCCIFGRSRAAGSGRPAGQSRHPTSRPRGRLPGRAPPGPGCPGTPRDSPRYPGIARDSPGYSGIARDNPRPERGRGTVRERPLASAAARPGRGPRRDVPSGVTRCSSFASGSITLPRYRECSECRKLQYPHIAVVFISPGSPVPGIPLDPSPLQFQECCLCCYQTVDL